MKGERAQGLVEAVVVVPLCLVCAVLLVESGIVLRDRIATAQAATRAAEAALTGRDADAAGRAALPRSLRATAHVKVGTSLVVVTSKTRTAVLGRVGGVDQRSQVVLHESAEGAAS